MTLVEKINSIFGKSASSPAQRAVNAGHPNAAKDPSEAQKRVGNYQKVHLSIDGLSISIENPKGSVRRGVSPDGTRWSNVMACDYGYILGSKGVDGDLIDIYLSDHPGFGQVYVIDQVDPRTREFDEHKVMYGFNSVEEAKKAYLSCYSPDWKGLGWITPVTKADFREWLDSSARKRKPFHEYKSVDPIVDPIKVAQALGQQTASPDGKKKEDEYEGVPQGVKLRSFIDAPATRTAIMDNVLEAVKNRFPIEDDDVRLELRDVKYEGPTSYTLEQQKNALLNNRRLGCGISGTWRLTDKKTGQVLDERRDGVLRVPYYTDRGTIINNGSEYTVISQARLSPGVYVRRKQNGELESQFNVENGLGFRIGLNRETGVLDMSIGQGHVPLYPVLRAIGVSDDDIRKSWGDKVASVNLGKMDPRALDKVYARYAGSRADQSLSMADKAKFVTEALSGSKLDPNVVVRTLGLENVNGVTGQVMLRAAQKLLNINRGEEDPDERDNPRFSKYYGIEDMLRERIDKDSGRLTKSILFRAKRDKSLARVGRNALAPYLDTFLSGSGLAMPGEEANPLSLLTQQSRITRLGEGGISSPDLVTPEARNVQGDYLGYVDFISGPESFGIGIDVRAALGTMKGSDHRLYNKMIDMQTGRTRYVALDDASSHTVAFPGQDPKAPKLYAMRKGVPTLVPREEVDYMVPGFGNTVSAGINMTPMPTAVQAGRQFYMSKFWEQYLPQKEGEVPLVDSLMDDGKTTYSEYYGRKVGCLTAPFAGTVVKANDKEIVVRGKDGKTHTASLVKGLPFNRLSAISYTPQVKKGDEIAEGGILANSNFTDAKTGAMNMGRNLKVAVLPAPLGVSSYEDAIVISESAAKKLSTSRMYNFDQDTKDGVQIQRNKYLAAFPKAYTKDQADTIDDNGVVKVGTVLHRDDPMILAIGPKMLSAEDAQLGKLSSVLRNALTDKSQKWEHDWPGVVTDVVAGPHGVKVLVKSEPPVKVGDKLAPEEGLKGVVGGILPDDKMPRDSVTNEPYDMLMNPMGFLSRVAPGQIMLMNLAKVAKKTGKQIRIPQIPPPEGWEAWVEKQMADAGVKESADVFDPQTGRIIKDVGDGYVYTKAFHHLAEKKFSARGVEGAYTQDEQPAKGGEDGAKRISVFDDLSLLSHGATEVIKDSIVTRGQCFDDETEVLTRAGWKFWRDVSASDELLTKCKDGDGTSFYEKPERLVRNPYDGIMYGYENRHIDWLVTPDHDLWGINCLVSKKKPYRHYRTFKARDIFGKEGTIDAFGAVYRGSITADHVIDIVDDKTTRGKGSVKDVHINIFDYCSFMGWWLSEGCASYDGMRGEIKICQDAFVHPDEFQEIVTLGRKIGLGNGVFGKKHDSSGFRGNSPIGTPSSIRWRSKPLALHLMQFGNRAWNKRIPDIIFEAPLECRLEFLRCYIAGDGCERKTGHGFNSFNYNIGTSSPDMMHDIQRLAVISGLSAYICLEKKSGEYNYKHDYYRVIISNNTKETTIRKIPSSRFRGHYREHYSGFVYCATMSTGLVFVRRNGKCMWSGNCNDEYWRRYRLGLPVKEPDVPFIYKKFINTLKAGGVNVVEKGDVTSLMPQTDADIDELAQGRVIDSSQMVDADMNPVNGGLFDLSRTGGMGGNRWSMITLPEAVPNPMMEEPVRRVLGLTGKKMEAIMSGREQLNGKTGGEALRSALASIDVDDAIERARAEVQNYRGSQRDNAVKVLGYLKAAKEMGKRPEDWMITRIPVLPPMFRPIAKMGDTALVPDMNELYKELIEMKRNYEDLSKELPASALADERLAVYGAVKAAYGLGDPVTAEGRAKNLKGAIRQVIGTVPKFSMFQSKVISKTQDNVGRSVTIPDKNLSMDQIGLPEDMAWTMFKPHVERKLVQRGYSPVDAKKMIDDKNQTARHILEDVMQERPVLMDRAPTWHKFNILAFKPHIVEGRSIHVCPLIDSGFNMDHDGDLCRSPYVTIFMSDRLLKNRPLTSGSNLCYNPTIKPKMVEGVAMRKETVVIDGKNIPGVVVNMRWEDFPHYENPTLNSHPNARFYVVPEGVCVRAYDEKTGKTVWAPVRYWSHHGVNEKLEMITVELSSGRQILTDDDPRGVYGIDPKTMTFGRWRPSDAIGKFVPRCIRDSEQASVVHEIKMCDYSCNKSCKPIVLDRTAGWFFGAMIGDGWATHHHDRAIGICFCYDKNYNDLGSSFMRSVEHVFYDDAEVHFGEVSQNASEISGRYGDAKRITLNSAAVGRFVGAVIGRGAENKHLPQFWHNAPVEFKLGMFEGLLDTDGTLALVKAKAKKNSQLMCNYTTVSMTLATEVQYLCRTLGVDSKLTTQKTPAGGKCWQVSISTKNLKSLGLELKSPHKAKALEDADIKPDTSAGGRKYMIPVPVNDLKRVKSILLALDRSAYTTLSRTSKLGYVPTTLADKIAKVLKSTPEIMNDAWKAWFSLYNNIDNVVWERVEGFTNTGMFEDGFDLTVPGYETFMNSEGVILSNTVNIHVPASEKAAKQALEKMLPSKNLISLTDLKSVRYKPEKEQISGLWALTRGKTRKPTRVFATKAEATAAYRNGEIGPNDPIEIKDMGEK